MTNKDFTSELARRTGCTQQEAADAMGKLTALMAEHWQDGDTISIQGFGQFAVKKRLELVTVNPVTKQRMLIPPKLVLTFRPAGTLKDRLK